MSTLFHGYCTTMARVVNMTIACELHGLFNLKQIAERNLNFKYDPRVFTAARFRCHDPNYSALLFSSGRVTLTGVNSLERGRQAIRHFCVNVLGEIGYETHCKKLKTDNYVGTLDLHQKLNLPTLYQQLRGPNCSYETELFPGLILRMPQLNATCLFFSSGKINFTGFKRKHDIRKIQRQIKFIVYQYLVGTSNSNK